MGDPAGELYGVAGAVFCAERFGESWGDFAVGVFKELAQELFGAAVLRGNAAA
jgi:hypothetical protein